MSLRSKPGRTDHETTGRGSTPGRGLIVASSTGVPNSFGVLYLPARSRLITHFQSPIGVSTSYFAHISIQFYTEVLAKKI